jgi:hypothetical protein
MYKSKKEIFSGSSYPEVAKKALRLLNSLRSQTKRRPYLRSKYFKKDKIFLDYFWFHLKQKNLRDQTRRLKFFACALDLIRNCQEKPKTKKNPNNPSQILHRFTGVTHKGLRFAIQIREERNGQKSLVSFFPIQ